MGSAGAIYGSITAATAKTSFQFVKLDNVIVSGDIYAGGFIGNIEDPDALDFSNNAVKDVEIRGSHTGGQIGRAHV